MRLQGEVVSALKILVFKRCTGLAYVAPDLGDGILLVAAERSREIFKVLLRRIEQLGGALLRPRHRGLRHIGRDLPDIGFRLGRGCLGHGSRRQGRGRRRSWFLRRRCWRMAVHDLFE